MTLQSKLALLCSLAIVPILLGLGLGVYLVAQDRTYQSLDSSLATKIESIKSTIGPGPSTLDEATISLHARSLDRLAAEGGVVFRIADKAGVVLYSSTAEGSSAGTIPPTELTTTLELDGVRTRVSRSTFVVVGDVVGYVEVRESLTPLDGVLADLRLAMTAGITLAAVLMIVAVYLLAKRVAASVRDVSSLAASIEAASDFTRRLPDIRSSREVRELRATFNALLSRIEAMMEAQKAFFAESSHELRRPLTVLRTNIDVLALPNLPDNERVKVQKEMQVEATSMAKLLSQLLLLAKGDLAYSGRERVNLPDLAQTCVDQLREYCHDHEISVALEQSAPIIIEGDPERLRQLVGNLLDNAHAYTPPGGRIAVRVKWADRFASLEVEDDGVGMSDAELDNVFDRFFRGDAGRRIRTEGFGLGLSIVKHVAESHGGMVTIQSEIGSGTLCTVFLPIFAIPAQKELRATPTA